MRSMVFALPCLMFAALPAAALEKGLVNQIARSAREIAMEANSLSEGLQRPQLDTAAIKRSVASMDARIASLRKLAAEFESAHPSMNDRDRTEWKLLKSRVDLIGRMQESNTGSASADVEKSRLLIRARAVVLASRAHRLRVAAEMLRRG